MRNLRILALLAFLCAGLILVAELNAASMSLRVATLEGEQNSIVRVPIVATGIANVGALQFDLIYDPGVLGVVSVTRGAPEGNELVDSNSTVPGQLRIGIVTTDGIKSDAAVANVEFKLLGSPGMSSPLTIENARAWDTPAHLEVLVRAEDGQVNITAASPPWLILGAILGLVLLALFLLLFALTRRRKPAPAYAPVTYTPASYVAPPTLPETQIPAGWRCARCGAMNNPAGRFCATCGAARP